ncbi:hypothetical protein D3C78_1423000 [compost metagenome]
MQQQLDVAILQHHETFILAEDLHLQQGAVEVDQPSEILGVDQGTGAGGSWHGVILLEGVYSRFAYLAARLDRFHLTVCALPLAAFDGKFILIPVRFWLVRPPPPPYSRNMSPVPSPMP